MTTARRAGTASVAVVTGLVLALGLTHGLAPGWVRRVGIDVWNLAEANEKMREVIRESGRRQEEAEQLLESIEVVEYSAASLAIGRLSLSEAVTATEPLLRDRTGFSITAELYYPAPTFRLSIARYLIDHVRRALEDDPDRLVVVLPRLEAEYAAMAGASDGRQGIHSGEMPENRHPDGSHSPPTIFHC